MEGVIMAAAADAEVAMDDVADTATEGGSTGSATAVYTTAAQGLTLVHFSAQLERFLWDRGCAWGLCSP
jgi:hypothetical protein